MKPRYILITLLACLSMSAAAQITTITRAYEVAVSELRLPGFESGTIYFRECAACDAHTVRVNANTQYLLNNESLALGEFRAELKSIREKDTNIATVMHHLESDTVVAVMVTKN